MAIVITNDQNYKDIASALRDKGVEGSFKPSEMAAAVRTIETGSEDVYYRRVVVFGDSISAGYGNLQNYNWTNRIVQLTYPIQIRSITNYAVSGSGFGQYATAPSCIDLLNQPSVQEVIQGEDTDLIVLEYGGNDAKSLKTYRTDCDQIALAIEQSILKIRELAPDVPILVLSSAVHIEGLNTDTVLAMHMNDVRTITQYVCWKYNVRMAMITDGTGIGADAVSMGLIQSDNTHPTPKGDNRIAEAMLKFFVSNETMRLPNSVSAYVQIGTSSIAFHKYSDIRAMVDAGVDVTLAVYMPQYGTNVFEGRLSQINTDYLLFTLLNKHPDNVFLTGLKWNKNNTFQLVT